jgi:hypothetical protein
MEGIVVTDDELKRLEKRFGPGVRRMGSWNSDGIFGYSNVPILALERAAETLEDQNLDSALFRLRKMTDGTKLFVELLEMFGSALIVRIAAAYGECSLELMTGTHLASKPRKRETGRVSAAKSAA